METLEKDGKLYQVFDITRVSRLRTAILSNKIEDIGKFKTVQRLVNLNADKKRLWFEDLKSIDDGKIVDSFPLSFNFFSKQEI